MSAQVPESWSVTRVKRENHDTVTFELEQPRAQTDYVFAPGQFNMLYVFGVGEVPLSLSGDPSDGRRLAHTVRQAGAVTRALASLKKGETIGLRGPYGSRWPVEENVNGDMLMVAGGIGIAPLRPVVYSLLRKRGAYRHVALLYGARSPKDLLYVTELQKWRSRFDMEIEITVDGALSNWRGHVGVVTTLLPQVTFKPHDTTAMICGPEIMMRFAVRELRKRGVADERIFLSMERNMKCAVGFCGHCQFGPTFICRDGPVLRYDQIGKWLETREI